MGTFRILTECFLPHPVWKAASMKHAISRRHFLGTTSLLGAGVGLASLGGAPLLAAAAAKGAPNAQKLGWRLGMQAWSFNKFTFCEAVDKTACLGLRCIEAFPGQKFSKEQPEGVNEQSSPELRKAIKQKLADAGVKLVNYGVCGLSTDVDKSRKIFEFAKDMGIETIVSEPAEDAFDTVEKLCDEFEINVAIHNHPKPSFYWSPDTVLRVCKGRSKRIGACCDTGHWPRSGLNPIDCLKKLKGRIISFHFKDLNELGPTLTTCPGARAPATSRECWPKFIARG